MDLPNLTSIDMGPAHAVTVQIEAVNGGQVNLPALIQISDLTSTPRRAEKFTALPAEEVVNSPSISKVS